MKVIVFCDWNVDMPKYALVDLNEEAILYLRSKHAAFEKFSVSTNATEARWSFGKWVVLFSLNGSHSHTKPSQEERRRVALILQDVEDYVVVHDDFELPESMVIPTALEEVVVDADTFKFVCMTMGSDVDVVTASLPMSLIDSHKE